MGRIHPLLGTDRSVGLQRPLLCSRRPVGRRVADVGPATGDVILFGR
jgi:hypothetical protein